MARRAQRDAPVESAVVSLHSVPGQVAEIVQIVRSCGGQPSRTTDTINTILGVYAAAVVVSRVARYRRAWPWPWSWKMMPPRNRIPW